MFFQISFTFDTCTLGLNLLFLFSNANAFTKNQQEVLSIVMSVYGKVDKTLHERFWRDVPKEARSATSAILKQIKILELGQQLQKEMWKSALVSYDQRQVFESKEYQNVAKELSDLHDDLERNMNPSDAKNSRAHMKRSQENAKRLLVSAANHTNLIGVDGREVVLDRERITYVIKNIDQSFGRLKILLDPKWSGN